MAHLTRTGPSGSKAFPQPTLPAWTPTPWKFLDTENTSRP